MINNNKTGEIIKRMIQHTNGISILGYIDDTDLIDIYMKSNGLIFASLYEGFGIPILEAQQCKCPVITSSCSSMPEIAGSGALIVDPDNVKSITEAMLQLDNEAVRKDLIEKGEKNLQRFRWENASNETLNLMKSITQ